MSAIPSRLLWSATLALGLAAGSAHADPQVAAPGASAPDGTLESVHVKGVKDPATLPVKFIYLLNRIVAEKAEGRWVMRWRITGPDRVTMRPGTRVWIEGKGEDDITPVSLDAQGLVSWPALPAAVTDKAELVSNQAKGQMRLRGDFETTLPVDGMSTADFSRSVDVLERAWKEMKGQLPWAFRWVIPSYNGVGICHSPQVPEAYWDGPQGRTGLIYLHKGKGRWAGLQCAVIRAGVKLPEGAKLVAAPGTRLVPWLPSVTGDQVSND